MAICILILIKYVKIYLFSAKMIEKAKIREYLEKLLQFMKFLDISRIFCSFSYLKSFVLFKTEQQLTEVRMEMSL